MMAFRIGESPDVGKDRGAFAIEHVLVGGAPSAAAHTVFTEVEDGRAKLAMASIEPAEESDFATRHGVPAAALRHCASLSTVWLREDHGDQLPCLLYAALRRARAWGKNTVLLMVDDRTNRVARLLEARPLVQLKSTDAISPIPMAQEINYAMQVCFTACEPATQQRLQEEMTGEVLATFERWIRRLFSGSWFRAIYEQRIVKEQYIQSLCEIHHYVRQTTRHLGRAIATSSDRALRNHYIDHLRGEINHEVSIELDLKHLGIDTTYLLEHRVPSLRTKQFMSIQESTIAFYQDPVLFLACPLAAEGITANLDQAFLDALYGVIASWGVKKPTKAARFLTSHIHTDGGGDGHWQNVLHMVRRYIATEIRQQEFLAVLTAAMDALEASLNANIDQFTVWNAVSVPRPSA